MTNETQPLHLQFAKVKSEKALERETIIRRCATSLFWCNEYFEAFDWAIPDFTEEDTVGDGPLADYEDPTGVLVATLVLKAGGSRPVTVLEEILSELPTEDIERVTYAVELPCGHTIAASEAAEAEDIDFQRALMNVVRGCEQCPSCERTVSYLILSHIVHPVTLPLSTITHIAHAPDEIAEVRAEFKDSLLIGLDHAYSRALEIEFKGLNK